MNSKRVCVIGAGPSGITAIKNIADKDIELVAYDYNSDVGGNWIYNEDESHSSVFETTHIISSKTLSQYEDFPFDYNVSDYPSHEELRNYFQSYAKHFDLYKFIEFNTLVKSCNLNSNKLENISFLYRKIDQYSWKFCNKGFFNFKNYIPKIIQEFT